MGTPPLPGEAPFRERSKSKYPPAKPGALRALAPQRGLTARGGPGKYAVGTPLRMVNHCHILRSFRNSTLPEPSNSGSPPAEPGVYLGEISASASPSTASSDRTL